MATYYSDQLTKLIRTQPPQALDAGEGPAKVYYSYGKYTTSGNVNGDVLCMVRLPAGAILLADKCVARFGALGTSVTLKVGYSGNDAAFKTATSAASAGKFTFPDANVGTPTKIAPFDLLLTIGGANPANGMNIEVEVFYTVLGA